MGTGQINIFSFIIDSFVVFPRKNERKERVWVCVRIGNYLCNFLFSFHCGKTFGEKFYFYLSYRPIPWSGIGFPLFSLFLTVKSCTRYSLRQGNSIGYRILWYTIQNGIASIGPRNLILVIWSRVIFWGKHIGNYVNIGEINCKLCQHRVRLGYVGTIKL